MGVKVEVRVCTTATLPDYQSLLLFQFLLSFFYCFSAIVQQRAKMMRLLESISVFPLIFEENEYENLTFSI